jgi:hypothetical protein
VLLVSSVTTTGLYQAVQCLLLHFVRYSYYLLLHNQYFLLILFITETVIRPAWFRFLTGFNILPHMPLFSCQAGPLRNGMNFGQRNAAGLLILWRAVTSGRLVFRLLGTCEDMALRWFLNLRSFCAQSPSFYWYFNKLYWLSWQDSLSC